MYGACSMRAMLQQLIRPKNWYLGSSLHRLQAPNPLLSALYEIFLSMNLNTLLYDRDFHIKVYESDLEHFHHETMERMDHYSSYTC